MARGSVTAVFVTALFLGVLLRAQEPQAPPPPAPKPQDLPEEDESLKPKVFSLNPVQAANDIEKGNFYFKKGKFGAAASRYKEATQWDPGNAEAFAKLGEACERIHDYASAREAFGKYFELSKDAKDADAIRKRMSKWPRSSQENRTNK